MGETKERKFYKTIMQEVDFGDDRKIICHLLKKCCLYPEYEVKQVSGGRDGDMYDEVAEYVLFNGGYAGGMPSGMQVGVYQLTVRSCNGFCQYLSVILREEPEENAIPEKKEAFQELLQEFEGHDFAPKNSYLKDPEPVKPTYRKFLEELIQPPDNFLREGYPF